MPIYFHRRPWSSCQGVIPHLLGKRRHSCKIIMWDPNPGSTSLYFFKPCFKKGKLRKAVCFIWKRHTGVGCYLINRRQKIRRYGLNCRRSIGGKTSDREKNLSIVLEAYKETPLFIPVDITEEVVVSVAWKLSGSSSPGETDLEVLQGWILKFGDHSRKLCIIV